MATRLHPFGGIARAVVLVAVAIIGIIAVLLRERGRDAWNRASGTVEHRTGIGERRTVRLSDGSRIMLSVATTVRYAAELPADRRPVVLIGEAFFVVAADSARPLVVTAGPAIARSNAGAFAVRAFADENTARVVVDSGAVEVSPASAGGARGVRIESRSVARIARDGALTRRDSIEPADFLGWRSGRIVLDDVPLRAALTEVGRWQNLDLQIGDSVVANRRVTATFASHQTVTEILDGIALQAGARYERSGRTVTFRLER